MATRGAGSVVVRLTGEGVAELFCVAFSAAFSTEVIHTVIHRP